MRVIALAAAGVLAGCAIAAVERSARNEIAVVPTAYEERIGLGVYVRVRADQVMVPGRADGQEEFCSTSPTFYVQNGRPQVMCFRDTDGRGRFGRAYTLREDRAAGSAVNIPYAVRRFPCSSCAVSSADLSTVSDPQILAGQSIAPAEYRPYVQLALAGSPDVEAAIDRSTLPDKAMARDVVAVAAREVRDRQAVAICSSQNPGAAANFLGPLGSLAAIAGSAGERDCMNEYMRTRIMPLPRPA